MTKSSNCSDLGNLKVSNEGIEGSLGVPVAELEYSEVSFKKGQYVDSDDKVELGTME